VNGIAGWERVRSGELLYSDVVGRDACGIGGIAVRDGKPSHEVLRKAVNALNCMEHRGGVCGDAGDGAGITTVIPQSFLKEEARKLKLDGADQLKADDRLAVGVVFHLEQDAGRLERVRTDIREKLSGGPIRFLGLRTVPVNPDALPGRARQTKPAIIEQFLFHASGDIEQTEHWLYLRRLELREHFRAAGLNVYLPSLSSKLISYKGLVTSPQLSEYYADLSNPAYETGIAFFHRRYSTNTFPNWMLAQPFRMTCHNGEINTIRTTRNAVSAFARGLRSQLPGGELLTPLMSDSGSLDEWIEYLMLEQKWSLLRALRLSMPPVWDTEADVWGQEAFDLFTYYRRTFGSLAAWDGPAGVIGTDGRTLVGVVDRMGLRPVRWCSDRRGWLYIGSETGVFGLDATTIVASGQLQPGQMIALDTHTGERLDSYQIMKRVVEESQQELGDVHELNRRQIVIPEGFDYTRQTDDTVGAMLAERSWALDHLLQAAGWDFERAVFVKDMAKLKKEPLSSMGHDRVLTVFSQHHPTLFKYLQQTFAEVTNPPIDPYREGGAMSLTTYLGRSPLVARQKPLADGTPSSEDASDDSDLPTRQMELPSPVVSDAIIEEIRQNEVLGFKLLDATFPLSGGAEALRASLIALQSSAEKAIHEGYHVLCVSDKEACKRGINPIPSLLALGAVHHYLCRQGLRDRCSLIVQAGDIQEGHDVCCLVAFGADAVHPYLMLRLVKDGLVFKDPDSKQELRLEAREALENLFAALEDTIKKVISKMGITTIEGYRGAQLFEAVGFGPELMEFLGDFPSRLGGIGLQELVEDAQWRVQQAEKIGDGVLGGNRDYRAFNPRVRMALRDAVKQAHPEPEQGGGEMAYTAPPTEEDPDSGKRVGDKYIKFTELVNTRVPTVLRDLFAIKFGEAVPVQEVQPALDVIRGHFRGAAMSHGALTGASHMTIAAAVNELDTLSNSGEGGEARWRNDMPERAWGPFWEKVKAQRTEHPEIYTLGGNLAKSRFRSRIRQVASGRFGVDAEYLVNADELSIKMAQGAKPGEGGQLMGKKVTAEIAEIRFAKPGTDLISPPPHHDIYSIEDLAQLIYDLKATKPGVPVSVKLVAVENIGTIAVGVAKAGADIVEIDGIDGGTGAAMVSSKEHAGLPSEMGLAEAHQALVVNGLRKSVKLRVGGGIKNGYDVIKYALFGADEFSFGQGLMVSVGCIVCKSCHIPNCPTGITGSPEIFKGHPEHTKAYLLAVANETRQLLAQMGFRHLDEITGRSDLLIPRTDLKAKHPRAASLSLAKFIHPDMALTRLDEKFPQVGTRGVCSGDSFSLNQKIMNAAHDAVDTAQNADLVFRVKNSDRSVGATVAGMIARLYGREGMPNQRKIKVRLEGEAGQSFGAWCINGLDLELRGFAQDGVAKGISGGTVVVTLDYTASDYGGEVQSVAGNNVGYGATGGAIYIGGRAGHRLGIRNSGATIVAEAAGKYACEYMTRGRVVILGPVENEIGSGMTGGELVIFDPHTEVPAKLHGKSVTVIDCSHVDYEWLHPLLYQYHARTGSRQAEYLLKNWGEIRRGRRLRKVLPLSVARAMEDLKTAGTNAG
jgi:glutamate synthase domain-containing protein 2/glutamate synthase domain-containing protein 1/glutamate synthase domain-containing protein 3